MAQRIIIPSLNYDQQSIPTNPSQGQVWRQRDISNNVVETWFWNGINWLTTSVLNLFSHRFTGISGGFSGDLNLTASLTPNCPGRVFFPLPVSLGANFFIENFYFNTDAVTGTWTVDLALITIGSIFSSVLPNSSISPLAVNTQYVQAVNATFQKTVTNYIIQVRPTLISGSGSLRITDFGFTARKVY